MFYVITHVLLNYLKSVQLTFLIDIAFNFMPSSMILCVCSKTNILKFCKRNFDEIRKKKWR